MVVTLGQQYNVGEKPTSIGNCVCMLSPHIFWTSVYPFRYNMDTPVEITQEKDSAVPFPLLFLKKRSYYNLRTRKNCKDDYILYSYRGQVNNSVSYHTVCVTRKICAQHLNLLTAIRPTTYSIISIQKRCKWPGERCGGYCMQTMRGVCRHRLVGSPG